MKISNMQIANMLETASAAARLAGQKSMELFGYNKKINKSADEIVTNADPICQDLIISRIKEVFPDHGFIAEEGKDGNIFKQVPRGEPFWWIIDPIDGTNNYANKVYEFCTSVAVMYEAKPVAGAIFQPCSDLMFTASINTDAQLNGSTIKCSSQDLSIFTSAAVDSLFPDGVPSWVNKIMTKVRFRNLGTTALHLAYVASGAFCGAITESPRLWDIAAGMIILQQAGALLTDLNGNKIDNINPEEYNGKKFDILAAAPNVQQEILNIIKG